jgi:outer membrane protein assembly factor BamB
MATPLVGQHDISHLVIFSVSRTLGRGSDGTIFALCKETGDIVWEFGMPAFGWRSPGAVYTEDGTSYLIVSDSTGRMFLLQGTTGEELYRINLGGNIEASPIVFYNMLVVGTRGNRIVGVEIS